MVRPVRLSGHPAPMEDALPVVLVLGNFAHEGLTAKVESLGLRVVNKQLRSSPRNWQKIADFVEELVNGTRLPLTFAYISTPLLLDMAEPAYDEVRPQLIAQLQRTRTLLFVYEANLQGVVDPFPWDVEDQTSERARVEVRHGEATWDEAEQRRPSYESESREAWSNQHEASIHRAMNMLDDWSSRSGLEVVPFRKRADVTIRMFEALEDAQAGIFLRLYVPHGRYQSEQFEDFLTLFSRYLRDVEGKEFSIDVERTSRGTTYVFKGRGEASTLDDLRGATARFDGFLALAQANAGAAERLLVQAGTTAAEAPFIVAKYERMLRRLRLETRQEFERRTLLLEQSFEAELLDLSDVAPLPVPSDARPSSLFAVVGNAAPVTVNFSGIANQQSNAVIDSVVNGGIHYGPEDREILTLIASVRDEVEALRLRSELDRLKDAAISPVEKLTAIQKLKAFVYSSTRAAGKKAEEIGTQVLIAYLDAMVTGGQPH